MNPDDLDALWRSPHNQPTPRQLEEQRMQLLTELKRRHRASRGLLWFTLLPLLVMSGLIVKAILAPDPGSTPVNLRHEWAILLLVALPWTEWFLMLCLQRRHRRKHPNYELSIRASLDASIDESLVEGQRTKLIGGLLIASIPMIGLIVLQLRSVGKVGPEIIAPALIIWPAYVAAMVAWFAWTYHRRLLPRRRQLVALRATYE